MGYKRRRGGRGIEGRGKGERGEVRREERKQERGEGRGERGGEGERGGKEIGERGGEERGREEGEGRVHGEGEGHCLLCYLTSNRNLKLDSKRVLHTTKIRYLQQFVVQ